MNGKYLALKLAHLRCLINANHYVVVVVIMIVVEVSVAGSYLSKLACHKGSRGREGADGPGQVGCPRRRECGAYIWISQTLKH